MSEARVVWVVSAGDWPWNYHSPVAVFDNWADAEAQGSRLRQEDHPSGSGQKWSVEIDEYVVNRTVEQGIEEDRRERAARVAKVEAAG